MLRLSLTHRKLIVELSSWLIFLLSWRLLAHHHLLGTPIDLLLLLLSLRHLDRTTHPLEVKTLIVCLLLIGLRLGKLLVLWGLRLAGVFVQTGRYLPKVSYTCVGVGLRLLSVGLRLLSLRLCVVRNRRS